MTSITTAPIVETVGAGLPPSRTASFNGWGRKKHKSSSSSSLLSCFPPSTTSVSIERPYQNCYQSVPFKQTASFNHNVSSLCGQFPLVHQGVITSLLESAANDYSKASRLIRQVSEAVSLRAKRPRDWSEADVFMDDDEEVTRSSISDDDDHSSESQLQESHNSSNNNSVVNLHRKATNLVTAACSVSSNMVPAVPSETVLQTLPALHQPSSIITLQQPSAASQANKPNPTSATTTTTTSTTTSVDSYDDAVMNLSSSLESSSSSAPTASSSDAKIGCPNSPNQGLKHTIQVLSRVVLMQSDKISSLLSEQHRLVEKNESLNSSLIATTDELRQCREKKEMLEFYLSSNRASTDFRNEGSDGGGFDFFSSNRMPDVY